MRKNGLLHTIIRRKVLVSMLFIGFSMMGYISYNKLPDSVSNKQLLFGAVLVPITLVSLQPIDMHISTNSEVGAWISLRKENWVCKENTQRLSTHKGKLTSERNYLCSNVN